MITERFFHYLSSGILLNLRCASVIFQTFDKADMIAGVATAGIPLRPKPKEDGLGNQIKGYYEPGKRIVVVEDLVSAGKSSLQVVDVLIKAGLKVEGMVSVFNYGFEEAKKAFEKYHLSRVSLTGYDSLLGWRQSSILFRKLTGRTWLTGARIRLTGV